jgi:hypothetical protein
MFYGSMKSKLGRLLITLGGCVTFAPLFTLAFRQLSHGKFQGLVFQGLAGAPSSSSTGFSGGTRP